MQVIKIEFCSDQLFWYNSHVGEFFEVLKTEEDVYWVREPSGYKNIVLKKDATIVERK